MRGDPPRVGDAQGAEAVALVAALRHSCQRQTLRSGSSASGFSGCSNRAAFAEAFPLPHARNPPGAGKAPWGLTVLRQARVGRAPSLWARVGIAHPGKRLQPRM